MVSEVIVKVGKQSDLIIDNRVAKAHRAITVDELDGLLESRESVRLLIIENIRESEYDKARDTITKFKKIHPDNQVLFYVKDNDSVTCGLADELAYDIYLESDRLFSVIEKQLGVSISTSLDNLKSLEDIEDGTGDSDDGLGDIFDSPFDDEVDTIDEELEPVEEEQAIDEEVQPEIVESEPIVSEGLDEELQKENSRLREEIRRITNILDALEDDRNTYKKLLESLEDNDEFIEEPISLEQYESLYREIEDLKSQTEELEQQVSIGNDYKEKLDETAKHVEELEAKIAELQEELAEHKSEIDKHLEEIEELKVESNTKSEHIEELNVQLADKDKQLLEKEEQIEKEAEQSRLKDEQIVSLERFREVSKEQATEIDSLNKNVAELKVKLSSTDEIIESVKESAELKAKSLEAEKTALEVRLQEVNRQLAAKEKQYNALIMAVGVDETDASKLLESKKALEDLNIQLREQIVSIERELVDSNREKELLKVNIDKLEDSNRKLRDSVKAMAYGASTGELAVPPCAYTAKGKVVAVFGCGSFGITTTAMSIAYRLSEKSKVLFIDFDMGAPKADAWFKINPIVRNIPGTGPTSREITGLGLLVRNGVDFFVENYEGIINRAIKTRRGNIDYISGFYMRPKNTSVVAVDYTSFMNFCGERYDYIIMDLGKIGYSEINDTIIKMVSDIAYKNILVTTNDRFEIRTLSMKLEDNSIVDYNTVWVINMCGNTNLDDASKRFINSSEYVMIPFSSNLWGKRMDFDKDRLTRDRFNPFIRGILK